jgi:transcription elongation factor Elf1
MNLDVTTKVRCPHCGKKLTVHLDLSSPEESWLEDCQICKQSIAFSSLMREGTIKITATPPEK